MGQKSGATTRNAAHEKLRAPQAGVPCPHTIPYSCGGTRCQPSPGRGRVRRLHPDQLLALTQMGYTGGRGRKIITLNGAHSDANSLGLSREPLSDERSPPNTQRLLHSGKGADHSNGRYGVDEHINGERSLTTSLSRKRCRNEKRYRRCGNVQSICW
jgi:hypothetical protein